MWIDRSTQISTQKSSHKKQKIASTSSPITSALGDPDYSELATIESEVSKRLVGDKEKENLQ